MVSRKCRHHLETESSEEGDTDINKNPENTSDGSEKDLSAKEEVQDIGSIIHRQREVSDHLSHIHCILCMSRTICRLYD